MATPKYKPSLKTPKALAPLPRWELALYFAVWFGHSIYAWYVVWGASKQLEDRLYSGFFEPGWRLLGNRKRDTSNFEWCSYFAFLPVELLTFFVHLVAMKIIQYLFRDQTRSEAALTMVWVVLLWIKLGCVGVLTTAVQGFLMLLVSKLTKWKVAVWFCACCLLGTLATDVYPLEDDADLRYRFSVYVAYKLLHFISFCTYHIDVKRGTVINGEVTDDEREKHQQFISSYYAMLRYTLYPPYASTLIVCYHDYIGQWHRRHVATAKTPTFMILRFVIWTLVTDVLLHFIFNNAMMVDPYLLMEVDLVTLCAVGYTAGQYFYMKYVSIFGLNTIFALLDGMEPPKWPPICISRVALYSNMWRHFDRGLYAFLRDQIFIPIALPYFAFWKRTFATLVCFCFIWLWHGLSWGFLFWVSLNFIEVTLENVTKQIYRLPSVHSFVNSTFTPSNVRRIQACMHIVCIAFGILSIFYFLGGMHVGHVFVHRLVMNEALYLNSPLCYLVLLGYCFAHVCMELEARVQSCASY